MTYVFHRNTAKEDVDQFVINSDQNTLYQCHEWADVKKDTWSSYLTSVTEDSKIVGTALVLIRKMVLNTTLVYIPRGPVMDYKNAELVRFYIAELKKLAVEHHAIVLRFDPAILSRIYPYHQKDMDIPYMNNDVIDLLKSLGAKHKGFTKAIIEATQPRYNAAMMVTPDYKKELIKNTAQSIRTAEKRGAEIKVGHEYLSQFAEAMHYTEVRQKVALRNEEYFRKMIEAYGDHAIVMVAVLNFNHQREKLEADLAEARKLLVKAVSKKEINSLNQRINNDLKDLELNEKNFAEEGKDEVIICGKLVCFNEKRMEFFYMGNNTKYMRIRANYYLYNKFLELCVEKGIPYCSFGGIEGTLDDGLTQFKSAWPINIEEYIGEFNIVLNAPLYFAFSKLYPLLLKTAARIRGNS